MRVLRVLNLMVCMYLMNLTCGQRVFPAFGVQETVESRLDHHRVASTRGEVL